MTQEKRGLNVSVKSFLAAILVILFLMVATFAMTLVVPGGEYARVVNESGDLILDPNQFRTVEGGLPFWKWLLSPVLVLGAEGGGMMKIRSRPKVRCWAMLTGPIPCIRPRLAGASRMPRIGGMRW